ncbi:MAG TPA: DUF3108 domain-containing protein [Stellaceae bacterium]|nr:DUF3108 domain-containing protein [Stellaceae bacterium]
MRFARYALLPGIAAAFFLVLHAGAVPAIRANRFQMRFEIFGFGGLHLLTDRTSVETGAAHYAIAMDLATRGLAGMFVSFASHSEVHGRLVGGAARPEEYSGEIRRNGADQQTRVDYGVDGTVLRAWTTPSPATVQATLVSADQIRGTVDQLTAYFIVERELARRQSCAGVIPVFDGLNRYNLRFTDAPPEAPPADIGRRFPGPMRVCEMSRQDIGGPADHGDGAYRGKIQYARLPGGDRMVPVLMEFDTELGRVKGYLAELHGRDIDLRLMQ